MIDAITASTLTMMIQACLHSLVIKLVASCSFFHFLYCSYHFLSHAIPLSSKCFMSLYLNPDNKALYPGFFPSFHLIFYGFCPTHRSLHHQTSINIRHQTHIDYYFSWIYRLKIPPYFGKISHYSHFFDYNPEFYSLSLHLLSV